MKSINRRHFLKTAGAAIVLPAILPGNVLGRDGKATFSKGSLASLTQPGQSVKFTKLPAAGKLAIRYASVEAGTISVAVNDQPMRKVNVHSSGALAGSFHHAIIDIAIPAKATLTISLAANDVAVTIDRIMVGDGDLGLPPDIWNLPPLPVARRSLCLRLEGDQPDLHRAGVVARGQVRRVVALGSAVHARTGRLVFARHVSGGQRAI